MIFYCDDCLNGRSPNVIRSYIWKPDKYHMWLRHLVSPIHQGRVVRKYGQGGEDLQNTNGHLPESEYLIVNISPHLSEDGLQSLAVELSEFGMLTDLVYLKEKGICVASLHAATAAWRGVSKSIERLSSIVCDMAILSRNVRVYHKQSIKQFEWARILSGQVSRELNEKRIGFDRNGRQYETGRMRGNNYREKRPPAAISGVPLMSVGQDASYDHVKHKPPCTSNYNNNTFTGSKDQGKGNVNMHGSVQVVVPNGQTVESKFDIPVEHSSKGHRKGKSGKDKEKENIPAGRESTSPPYEVKVVTDADGNKFDKGQRDNRSSSFSKSSKGRNGRRFTTVDLSKVEAYKGTPQNVVKSNDHVTQGKRIHQPSVIIPNDQQQNETTVSTISSIEPFVPANDSGKECTFNVYATEWVTTEVPSNAPFTVEVVTNEPGKTEVLSCESVSSENAPNQSVEPGIPSNDSPNVKVPQEGGSAEVEVPSSESVSAEHATNEFPQVEVPQHGYAVIEMTQNGSAVVEVPQNDSAVFEVPHSDSAVVEVSQNDSAVVEVSQNDSSVIELPQNDSAEVEVPPSESATNVSIKVEGPPDHFIFEEVEAPSNESVTTEVSSIEPLKDKVLPEDSVMAGIPPYEVVTADIADVSVEVEIGERSKAVNVEEQRDSFDGEDVPDSIQLLLGNHQIIPENRTHKPSVVIHENLTSMVSKTISIELPVPISSDSVDSGLVMSDKLMSTGGKKILIKNVPPKESVASKVPLNESFTADVPLAATTKTDYDEAEILVRNNKEFFNEQPSFLEDGQFEICENDEPDYMQYVLYWHRF